MESPTVRPFYVLREVRRSLVGFFLTLFLLPCQAGEVVFAAYNVRNYLITDVVDAEGVVRQPAKPEKQIAAVLQVVQHTRPDILGIVEMGDESALHDFQARLKAQGIDLPHHEWLRGADPSRHLALLSRFPIERRDSIDDVLFDLDGRPERMARGILDVTLLLPGDKRLRVMGAHFKSRRPVPGVDDRAMRVLEAWHLRKKMTEALQGEAPVPLLVFGDFNDYKNEAPIREIIGVPGNPLHMRDLPLTDGQGEKWTFYWQESDLYSRIDYLFASQALWKNILLPKSGIVDIPPWSEASDHRAIYTTIQTDDL